VQEALTNVAKHARANQVRVTVNNVDGEILIDVQDDGAGFDRDSATGGFGLAGMQERVSLAGGTLSVESGEQGTLVTARLPTSRSDQAGGLSHSEQAASQRVVDQLGAG
jgi:signal transduction histidine kinase